MSLALYQPIIRTAGAILQKCPIQRFVNYQQTPVNNDMEKLICDRHMYRVVLTVFN